MRRLLLIVLCGAAGFFFACGGTTGGGINPPPPSCPTGAVTLNPTTIAVGGTSTASAPTGFTNGGFSANPASGVVTISGATVTGVGTGSATISGSGWTYSNGATGCSLNGAVLTVTSPPPEITITSLNPAVFRCDAECNQTETVSGSGFESGDSVGATPNANLLSIQTPNPETATLVMGLDTPHNSPGSFTFNWCRGTTTTCSNNWSVGYIGNQTDLVIGPDGELYNLDRTARQIWKFDSTATPDGAIANGCPYGQVSIAYDGSDNWVWANCSTGAHAYAAAAGNPVSGVTDGNNISSSSSEAGFYCGTEAAVGLFACLNTTAINPQFTYAPAGVEPWSVTMLIFGQGTQSQETDAFVYDRENTTLSDFVVAIPTGATQPTVALKSFPPSQTANPLALNGLTPASKVGTGNGGWYLVRFETGPLAGTVVLFSAYDNTLIFIDANTMTETSRVVVSLPAGFGTPFRIAADETNGRVVVALANVGAATSTSFLAVTPAGVVTPLTTVAQSIIAVGLGVSSDGTNIYACMRNQCQAVPNQ